MLLMECSNIKKYFGDRLVLDVENLKIYSEDRIGVIGSNGVGKTTLINILSRRIELDEGWVKLYERYSYISQLEEPENRNISNEMASKFGVQNTWDENMSGGEKTRFKLADGFSNNSLLIFADEPTSNVDIEGIELMEKKFGEYKGALVLISHDRNFLDKLCNKILEVEDGRIKIYNGNYSSYVAQKTQERERAEFEYDDYVKEKKRLEAVITDTAQKVKSIKRTPKRMGNSEARLHKMGGQKAKASLERAVKNVEKRIEHLEVKEKPKKEEGIKLNIIDSSKLHSKMIIEGCNINKSFGKKVIFNNAEFNIYNGSKTALIGYNGCGKSTLIKMIMNNDDSIKIAKGAKIGYFSQDMSILKENLTIIENVMESSIYNETFARILLARLLFKREDIYKKINVLSGGERVKVSFAKMLLQDINLLILDEPTNYMDINSLEVIETALKEYDRTLLFVSHDRRFIESVANQIMIIENYKINMFNKNYKEYLASKNKIVDNNKSEIEKQIFVLQNRLSELIGRLSMPSKKDDVALLDKEYHEVLTKVKKLKESI
ncbi:macrolide transport system ATP-binding/permease protein [Clostridium pascui]|uniref:ribosomal protection-like ABC-F family protein n=1 Tax=Clostridium pascui TaxID=46609 RepID=UPI0019587E11|nr:ABC-F type ribosomal protection protein [Clostridium pascui]MBM7871313.1 macrolide transport system ATP-binding/permease protein [Clostridium pascui]